VARDEGSDGDAPEPTQDHLRASDADRQRVADRLRRAMDEGRLTLLEYDERLRAAYAALTYGELAKVTSDLPAPTPTAPQAPARAVGADTAPVGPATPPGRAKAYLVRQGRAWLGGAVVTNGVWAATSGLDWHHYWPGVVLPLWAAGIAAKLVSGKYREEDDAKRRGRRRDHGLSHRSDQRSLPE
jgi:hypothetical protein